MGETKFIQKLTAYDILTVILYRSGIVVSAMAFVFFSCFVYANISETDFGGILNRNKAIIVFWSFVGSVNLSISFLHLYNKQILKGLRIITYSGSLILIILLLTGNLDYQAMLKSEGWNGKVSILGLGLVLAGFSGIGAKEAFCFKLQEGYAYAILLAITVLLHLAGFLNNVLGLVLLILNTLLISTFTIRKLFLPLYFDIGDKSRY